MISVSSNGGHPLGIWDTGILDNDLSLDVIAEFEDLLENGQSVSEATNNVLESFNDSLNDEDERAVVYLSLALIQCKMNCLQKELAASTLSIIESGEGLAYFDPGSSDYLKRELALKELKSLIINHI